MTALNGTMSLDTNATHHQPQTTDTPENYTADTNKVLSQLYAHQCDSQVPYTPANMADSAIICNVSPSTDRRTSAHSTMERKTPMIIIITSPSLPSQHPHPRYTPHPLKPMHTQTSTAPPAVQPDLPSCLCKTRDSTT